MKTIQEEARNLTIEEITKLEADTIGLNFFTKDSPIPFKDDESVTKYQNLLSGNDRTVNRELFVHFERRNRDIIETLVKDIIPNGQSLFMAQQTDGGIKAFIKNNDNRNYGLTVFGEEKKENVVSDQKAQSTDWITFFTHLDFAEIPESLSEDKFIKSVYQIFSYRVFPLRLQYHLEDEGTEELAEIAEKHLHLIRYRVIDYTYPLQINDLINNPTDIEKLRAEFKNDIFNSFDEFRDVIHYLFGFYSHLCSRIAEYESTKDEITRKEKWAEIFRKCAYKEREKNSSYGNTESIVDERFCENFDVLRSPDWLPFIEKEFESDKDNVFFKAFRNYGASSLFQEFNWYNSSDFNAFVIPFMNGIIEIANSLSSCTQKAERIEDVDELDYLLKSIARDRDSFFDTDWDSDKTEEKPKWNVDEKKLSEIENSVFYAICNIASTLKDKAHPSSFFSSIFSSKKENENLNGKRWFSFMRSLVEDEEFCMKEEQKTKNFVLFQKELLEKSYNSSSFNDFISQLTGVFEYAGFVSCIEIALEKLDEIKILNDNDDDDDYHRGYHYSYYKTSFDFIENALKSIKEKALTAKRSENDYPSWRHTVWNKFLDTIHSDETFRVDELPKQIDEWYWDNESNESKQKYDGKTSFMPLNLNDFRNIFYSISYSIPKTAATVLSDIFRVNDVYSVRTENKMLDKYKYSGLMENSPFIHSSVALFYRFLYGFFTLLRTNIGTLTPYNLPQTKILEYSLASYVASYISNKRDSYEKKNKQEDIRGFTRGKLFAKRYFEKKGGMYKPSMRSANIALKNAVKKEGLAIGESLKPLANFIDTKRKGDDLKNTPATSVYVLTQVLTDDTLFPSGISQRAIKKYRADYLNYYLLCNFIKALSPYFQERTESIVSEIVSGVLSYPFYNPKNLEKLSVESGFDYLLRQSSYKDRLSNYETPVCLWRNSFIYYPVYFWYSEQKDDRLYKSIQRFSYDCHLSVDFSNTELAKKQIEIMRDEFGRGTGDFYYNYYLGILEYKLFKAGDKNASLKATVEYYEKAFRFIYHAGRATNDFVNAVFELYSPIRKSQLLWEKRKVDLKFYSSYAEKIYSDQIEWDNKNYGFDISSPKVREVPILPLKRIWQWAEAAGLVDRSYEVIFGRVQSKLYGEAIWQQSEYCVGASDSKIVKNIETLVAELEKNDNM